MRCKYPWFGYGFYIMFCYERGIAAAAMEQSGAGTIVIAACLYMRADAHLLTLLSGWTAVRLEMLLRCTAEQQGHARVLHILCLQDVSAWIDVTQHGTWRW